MFTINILLYVHLFKMCIEKKNYASLFLKTRIVINRRHPNRKANKAPTTVYNNPVKRPYKVKNKNENVK